MKNSNDHHEPCDTELVTVVIPVYNAEAHLQETLDSVVSQTHRPLEIVAVDDGSEDGSLLLLEQYTEPVTIIRQQNRGAAAARNRGAAEARGKWLAFLDADDIWHPAKLQKQLNSSRGFSWSYTDSVFRGGVNDGKKDSDLNTKFHGHVLPHLVCNNFISTSTVIVERNLFIDFGGFDTSTKAVEDWELWMRIAARHDIGYVNEPLVEYRVHPSSMSRKTRETLPQHMKLLNTVFTKDGPAPHLDYLMSSAIANSCAICSQIAEEEGDYRFSLYCALAAFRNDPFRVGRWSTTAKSLAKCVLSMFFSRRRRFRDFPIGQL